MVNIVSTVAEILHFDTFADLPNPGSTGIIYWTPDTNIFWVWSGSAYTSAHTYMPLRIGSVASSATPSINCSLVDQFNITALAAAITGITITGTPVDGQLLVLRIKDNGTIRAITHGASFVAGGVAMLTTTAANKTHVEVFRYDAAKSLWYCQSADATGY